MKPVNNMTTVLVIAILSSLTLTYCKKDKKSDKRTTDTGTDQDFGDDLYPDGFGPGITIKADALSFNRPSPLLAEPASCFGFDIVVLGGEDGFLAAVDQDSAMTVTSTSATTEFFTDNLCQTKGNELPIANGLSYGSLYARDNNPGTFDLKVVSSKGTPLKPAEIKVISAKAAKLKFFMLIERSFTANNCEPVILAIRSSDDLEVFTTKANTVNLAVSAGAGQFFDAEDCSGTPILTKEMPNGYSDTAIYVKATSTGPLTLQATAPAETGYENANITVNVDPKN